MDNKVFERLYIKIGNTFCLTFETPELSCFLVLSIVQGKGRWLCLFWSLREEHTADKLSIHFVVYLIKENMNTKMTCVDELTNGG